MTVHNLNLALRFAIRVASQKENHFLFLKEGRIWTQGGYDCITPDAIEAVYGVPVTIKHYNQYSMVINQ